MATLALRFRAGQLTVVAPSRAVSGTAGIRGQSRGHLRLNGADRGNLSNARRRPHDLCRLLSRQAEPHNQPGPERRDDADHDQNHRRRLPSGDGRHRLPVLARSQHDYTFIGSPLFGVGEQIASRRGDRRPYRGLCPRSARERSRRRVGHARAAICLALCRDSGGSVLRRKSFVCAISERALRAGVARRLRLAAAMLRAPDDEIQRNSPNVCAKPMVKSRSG